MSEIKFTEEELKSVGDLQGKYNDITNKLGNLSIARLNVKKQLELLIDQEDGLHAELESNQGEEQKLLTIINKKYGAGQLDASTGIFTPTEQ
mgnify:CR=1 FL=1